MERKGSERMKVSELYCICLELIENDKAHYDVCLVDREDYDIYAVIRRQGESYNEFKTFQEAKEERDYWESINWDWEMVEW